MRGSRRLAAILSSESSISRAVLFEDLSPLLYPTDMVKLLRKFGFVEGIRQIHSPYDGSYTRKMLVVMDSQKAARRILSKRRRRLSKEKNIWVTTSRYRKLGKPVKGQYKLYLRLAREFPQDRASKIEEMGIALTQKLVDAFQDFKYTSLELGKTISDRYSGIAEVRFKNEKIKAQVLARCNEKLDADGLWEDTKNKAERHQDPHYWCARACEVRQARASAANFAAGEAAGSAEE